MTEEIKQAEALTEDEHRCLFGWGENIFGELPHSLKWRPKEVHFILYSNGEPVSHVALLKHIISVSGEGLAVAGVGGVVTVPQAQRKGMAHRLMQHAKEFVEREWLVDFGLLFCLPKLEAYYGRLGWQTINDPVTISQPGGAITSPLIVMVLPVRNKAWSPGTVDLQSLPW